MLFYIEDIDEYGLVVSLHENVDERIFCERLNIPFNNDNDGTFFIDVDDINFKPDSWYEIPDIFWDKFTAHTDEDLLAIAILTSKHKAVDLNPYLQETTNFDQNITEVSYTDIGENKISNQKKRNVPYSVWDDIELD